MFSNNRMKDVSFKQKLDKRATYITVLILLACVGVTVWLYLRSTASFLSGWFFLQSSVLVLLAWIGMPKLTTVSETGIRISCTLRLLTFAPEEILSVESVEASAVRVFAVGGFMGYMGYYYFKPLKEKHYVLARAFSNLVLIRCADHKSIVIGVPDVQAFLQAASERGIPVK